MMKMGNYRKVWEQDAVDRVTDGSVDVWKKYYELTGYTDGHRGASKVDDLGDTFRYHMRDGWLVVIACDGETIYKPLVPSNLHDVNNDYTFGTVNTFRVRGEADHVQCIPLLLRWGRIANTLDDDWMIVALDLSNGELRSIPLSHIEPR